MPLGQSYCILRIYLPCDFSAFFGDTPNERRKITSRSDFMVGRVLYICHVWQHRGKQSSIVLAKSFLKTMTQLGDAVKRTAKLG